MFRLLVIPHYYFQRVATFHTTNKVFVHPTIVFFGIGTYEFNRKTRSSAVSGKV
jgi:hypothetical protein